MSERYWIFTRLDPLDASGRLGGARDALGWLRDQGIVSAAIEIGDVLNEAAVVAAGPQWQLAVASGAVHGQPTRYARELTVSVEPVVESAMENFEDPRCARCDRDLDSDASVLLDVVDEFGAPVSTSRSEPFTYSYGDLIDRWLASGEPSVSCIHCGWAGLLGDWVTDCSPGVVGAPSVTFRDWPALDSGFIRALTARLGGRSRYLAAWS